MNKPQAEGKVNHVCTVERKRISSTLFSNKKKNKAQFLVYLKSFLLVIELDHQRSTANTLVNKMRLDIFVLFNIFNYYSLHHIMSLHFTVLINFDEY